MFCPALTKKELKVFAMSRGELIFVPFSLIKGMFVVLLLFLLPVISFNKFHIF
jgi:hypothetical protein